MIEKTYNYKRGGTKIIEKIVNDKVAMINHMILPKEEKLPEHYSNSNVYIIIVKGTMTLKLNNLDPIEHKEGKILSIPHKTKMNVSNNNNNNNELLEFFVVKAPGPDYYGG